LQSEPRSFLLLCHRKPHNYIEKAVHRCQDASIAIGHTVVKLFGKIHTKTFSITEQEKMAARKRRYAAIW
jgi:hypothetical protein